VKTQINIDRLRQEIRLMTRTHLLYRVLRDELSARGFWKARARGNPSKGYQIMKERNEA
jgi:hypothetical protein